MNALASRLTLHVLRDDDSVYRTRTILHKSNGISRTPYRASFGQCTYSQHGVSTNCTDTTVRSSLFPLPMPPGTREEEILFKYSVLRTVLKK